MHFKADLKEHKSTPNGGSFAWNRVEVCCLILRQPTTSCGLIILCSKSRITYYSMRLESCLFSFKMGTYSGWGGVMKWSSFPKKCISILNIDMSGFSKKKSPSGSSSTNTTPTPVRVRKTMQWLSKTVEHLFSHRHRWKVQLRHMVQKVFDRRRRSVTNFIMTKWRAENIPRLAWMPGGYCFLYLCMVLPHILGWRSM